MRNGVFAPYEQILHFPKCFQKHIFRSPGCHFSGSCVSGGFLRKRRGPAPRVAPARFRAPAPGSGPMGSGPMGHGPTGSWDHEPMGPWTRGCTKPNPNQTGMKLDWNYNGNRPCQELRASCCILLLKYDAIELSCAPCDCNYLDLNTD